MAGSLSCRYPLHLSPWLEKTKWAEYLADQNLEAVVDLLALLKLEEVGLQSLIRSFDALVDSARLSVLSEEVNVFALHRIRSFVRGRSYEKPLHTKLLEGTYRKYQAVWHRLLSYTYRLAIARQGPNMPYVLTPAQAEALSQLLTCDARVYSSPSPSYSLTSVSPSVQYAADTRPCHLQQQHTIDEQVFDCADHPADRSADLIAPDVSQLPLADTSLASPAMTPGAVRGLQKDTRQDKPFKETDGTKARATVKEQQRCLNLYIALLN
jgi:hypothetical protein